MAADCTQRPPLEASPQSCSHSCPADLATLTDDDLVHELSCTSLQVGSGLVARDSGLPASGVRRGADLPAGSSPTLSAAGNALPPPLQARKIRKALTQLGVPAPAATAPAAPAASAAPPPPEPAPAPPAAVPVAAAPAPTGPAPGSEPDPRTAFNPADIARYRKLKDQIATLQALEVRLRAAAQCTSGCGAPSSPATSSFPTILAIEPGGQPAASQHMNACLPAQHPPARDPLTPLNPAGPRQGGAGQAARQHRSRPPGQRAAHAARRPQGAAGGAGGGERAAVLEQQGGPQRACAVRGRLLRAWNAPAAREWPNTARPGPYNPRSSPQPCAP